MTLAKAVKESSELQELIKQEPWVQEIFNEAKPLEGLNRNMGIPCRGRDHLRPSAGGDRSARTRLKQRSHHPVYRASLRRRGASEDGLPRTPHPHRHRRRGQEHRKEPRHQARLGQDSARTIPLPTICSTAATRSRCSSWNPAECRISAASSKWKPSTISAPLLAIYRPGPMEFIPDFVSRKVQGRRIEYGPSAHGTHPQ